MNLAQLNEMLAQGVGSSLTGDLLEHVRAVQESFRGLERPACPVEALVSLKFRMQQWRRALLGRVLDTLDQQGKRAFAVLAILELKPSAGELRILADWTEQQAAADPELRLIASMYFAQLAEHDLARRVASGGPKQMAENLLALAGPETKLPIEANAPSRCTFEKWSKMEEFSRYFYEGEGVRYRGLQFLPGDVILTNVNRDGNGVYTTMIEPRGYGYHLGVFAVFEAEGRSLPVVLETYKLGVRAVPLASFLDEKFLSYAEVCRLKHPPEGFAAKLNHFASKLPSEIRGYNFNTEDPDRSYLSCTTIATHLYEESGGPKIATKSRYFQDPQVQRNLRELDFGVPAFLSLSDYLVDPSLQVVGAVDNGHFRRNLARELCERYFVEIFRTGAIDLSRLPIMFHLNCFGIRQMRAGTPLGTLIGLPYGLTQDNLPKGPDKVLAIIEIFEHMLEKSVRKADPLIAAHWDSSRLVDVDRLFEKREIQEVLEDCLAPIRRGFPHLAEVLA